MTELNHQRLFRRAWHPMAILLVLVTARLAFAGLVFAHPALAQANDTDRYVPIAKGILSGQAYGWDTSRPGELLNTVGYPGFLAGVYALGGTSAGAVAVAQLLISGILALVMYLVMRHSVGKTASFFVAAILALDPLGILWSMTILTETLLAVCLGLAALTLIGWTSTLGTWRLLLAGLLVGAACLVKPYALLVAALWALGILVFPFGAHGPRLRRLWHGLRLAGLFVLPILALVVPWVVRNALLWNCPTLSSVDRVTMRDYVAAKILQETDHLTLEQAQAKLRTRDPGVCPQGNAKYEAMILAHPAIYAKLHIAGTIPVLFGTSFDRWIDFFGTNYAFPDLWRPFMDGGPGAVVSVVVKELFRFPAGPILMVALILWQVLIYFLAILGVLAYGKVRSWSVRWIIAVMTISVLILVLTPGQGGNERFRVPVQPLLAILAAYGAAWGLVPSLTRAKRPDDGARTANETAGGGGGKALDIMLACGPTRFGSGSADHDLRLSLRSSRVAQPT